MSMLFHQFSIIMNSVKDAHLFKHLKGEKKRLKLFTFHLPSRCIIRWVSEDVRFSVLIVVVCSDYDFIHLDKTMMKLLVCRCVDVEADVDEAVLWTRNFEIIE